MANMAKQQVAKLEEQVEQLASTKADQHAVVSSLSLERALREMQHAMDTAAQVRHIPCQARDVICEACSRLWAFVTWAGSLKRSLCCKVTWHGAADFRCTNLL